MPGLPFTAGLGLVSLVPSGEDRHVLAHCDSDADQLHIVRESTSRCNEKSPVCCDLPKQSTRQGKERHAIVRKRSGLAPTWSFRYKAVPVCRFGAANDVGGTMSAPGQADHAGVAGTLRQKARSLHSPYHDDRRRPGIPPPASPRPNSWRRPLLCHEIGRRADPNSLASDRFVCLPRPCRADLYAALAEQGVLPTPRLMTLRQFSSDSRGTRRRGSRVDAVTGSLGQGLSVGAGSAIGARWKIGRALYVLTGDGDRRKANVWKAAASPDTTGSTIGSACRRQRARAKADAPCIDDDTNVFRRKFEAKGLGRRRSWMGTTWLRSDCGARSARATSGRPFAVYRTHRQRARDQLLADKDGWHGKPVPMSTSWKSAGGT